MEQKATSANQEVPNEANQKYCIMAVPSAVTDTLECEKDKHQVGQGIHDLCKPRGGVVVLKIYQLNSLEDAKHSS